MTSDPLVLGLDSSTTGCKAVIWDLHGEAVSEGRSVLKIQSPHPGWHEQSALAWWDAACEAIRQVCASIDPARLGGLCIAHQRESFVPVDGKGRPLCPALLWLDQRGAPLLDEIARRLDREAFHRRTGKPFSANLAPAKLEWLRREMPGLSPAYILDTHAFLVHHLTGAFSTSSASADPLGLYDLNRGCWDAETLNAVGVNLDQMPQVFTPGEIMGTVTSTAARETGLPFGLPVIAGLGDGQASSLGSGLSGFGEASLSLGTSVIGGTCSPRYLTSRAFRTMTAGLPGAYILETVLLGGTYTINWFIEVLLNLPDFGAALQQLERAATEIPPGSSGLLSIPYWSGAMNPFWDPNASGLVLGLRGSHRREHIYRAILEGIALELRLHLEGVEAALGQPVQRLILSGGGARSPLWRSIIAAVHNREVSHTQSPETAALGAGILAAAGTGLHPDVPSAVKEMVRVMPESEAVVSANARIYERLYEIYAQLYPLLRGSMTRLNQIALQTPLDG